MSIQALSWWGILGWMLLPWVLMLLAAVGCARMAGGSRNTARRSLALRWRVARAGRELERERRRKEKARILVMKAIRYRIV